MKQQPASSGIGNTHHCSSQPDLLAHRVGVGQQAACRPPAPVRPPPSASLSSGSDVHAIPWRRAAAPFLGQMGYGVWRWWELDATFRFTSWVPGCPCSSSLLHTPFFFLTASPTAFGDFTPTTRCRSAGLHSVLHQLFTMTARQILERNLSIHVIHHDFAFLIKHSWYKTH